MNTNMLFLCWFFYPVNWVPKKIFKNPQSPFGSMDAHRFFLHVRQHAGVFCLMWILSYYSDYEIMSCLCDSVWVRYMIAEGRTCCAESWCSSYLYSLWAKWEKSWPTQRESNLHSSWRWEITSFLLDGGETFHRVFENTINTKPSCLSESITLCFWSWINFDF